MKFFFVIGFIFLFQSCRQAQAVYTQNDIDICESKFELANAENLSSESLNEIIVEIGKSFIGEEYEAHTLDKNLDEQLVIHLSGLDCYTFLESTLAVSRCIKKGNTTFSAFIGQLKEIRYRNGVLDGYPSRLHYFSDWIYNLNERGIIRDLSEEIGGIIYPNDVFFMSENPDKYKQLKDRPDLVEEIRKIEKEISSRVYYYIPRELILKIEQKILPGDIIGITTNISGLDIAHTGIAVRLDDGRIHLLHAPNIGKKIQITDIPLADYINKSKVQTGIMLARAVYTGG